MGISAGPNSVSDNLAFHIDPANPRSYAGVGTVIYDLSGNGKTSYFTNGAFYQNYQKGVVVVDGNNDYISTPLFNLTSPITVSAWVKNVVDDSPVFSASGPEVSYGNNEVIHYFSGKSILVAGNPTAGKYFQFPQLNLNQWSNLVMTRDVGNNMRVYLNGTGSTSNSQSYSNTIQMNQIGRYSNFTNQYNTRGSIGEVKIYNRALSATEISQNYNANRKKYLTSEEYVRDSLVLNLDFGNSSCYSGTGVTAYDLSGFGHTTYLINGASYNNAWGGNIFCDGGDDYIETPNSSNLNFDTDNFSVEYWYRKTELTASYENIWGVGKWNTGGSPSSCEWDLAIGEGSSGTGESTSFAIVNGSTVYGTGLKPISFNLNKFNHLVGIRNNHLLQIYYNGQLIHSDNPVGMTTSTSVNNVGRTLRVSNSALNQYYSRAHSGVVRLYRKALTADEVTQNYRALLPRFSDPSIITEGLVLNVDFGSIETFPGFGGVIKDISTGKTATLGGVISYNTNYGGNINLNGGNFNFSASNDFFFGTGNFTVEAWFTWDGTYAATGRVIYANNGSGSIEQLGIFEGNGIYAAGLLVNQFPAINTIQHIIGTRINGVSYMYLNGLLIGSGAFTSSIGVTANTLSVGYRYTDSQHPWKGDLPILRIYKGRGFTASDVAQNYNAMRYRF
jgi:hypothetical protein